MTEGRHRNPMGAERVRTAKAVGIQPRKTKTDSTGAGASGDRVQNANASPSCSTKNLSGRTRLPSAARAADPKNAGGTRTQSPDSDPGGVRPSSNTSGIIGTVFAVSFVVAGSLWAWSCTHDDEPTPSSVHSAVRKDQHQTHPDVTDKEANRNRRQPKLADTSDRTSKTATQTSEEIVGDETSEAHEGHEAVDQHQQPVATDSATAEASSSEKQYDPDAKWEGPWVGALVPTAPVYSTTFRTRENMIGYLRHGTKTAAKSVSPLQKENCKEGWYRLHPYGYVCGKHVTPDLKNSKFAEGTSAPDIDAIVPYKYARNGTDGTPLYRQIPTSEDIDRYEPERKKPVAKPTVEKPAAETETPQIRLDSSTHTNPTDEESLKPVVPAMQATEPRTATESTNDTPAEYLPPIENRPSGPNETASNDDAERQTPVPSIATKPEGTRYTATDPVFDEPEEPKPWWMRERTSNETLTLDKMLEGSDSVLGKRMARGFFIAVDKTLSRNGRYWYKSTDGLFAPADRMSINSPPTFHGVELVGPEAPSLPIGWTKVSAARYASKDDGKTMHRRGSVDRFVMVPLTGKTVVREETLYRETTDGYWIKGAQLAVTGPGPGPTGMRPGERWVDINLTTQTLVAFEGDTPVFATMVSTGKKGPTKKTDHSTPVGTFRVREKHVAATMDGDGDAPGQSPYSIQDVPYVLYFERSYALHGAFWHNNFGNRMSHGCVNMAPLDAKRIFYWAEPLVPKGWHGSWATKDTPGSLVVVHD